QDNPSAKLFSGSERDAGRQSQLSSGSVKRATGVGEETQFSSTRAPRSREFTLCEKLSPPLLCLQLSAMLPDCATPRRRNFNFLREPAKHWDFSSAHTKSCTALHAHKRSGALSRI